MIKKPEANQKLKEGHSRHQLLYAVDSNTWDSWSEEEKEKNLIDYFGLISYPFICKVREDNDWHIWHLWIDLPDKIFEE